MKEESNVHDTVIITRQNARYSDAFLFQNFRMKLKIIALLDWNPQLSEMVHYTGSTLVAFSQ